MPGLEPEGGNPYPTIRDVMRAARARVGDMMNDVDGDLLTDDAPYSQTYLTAAWNWLQRKCATAGVETFIREITLRCLPRRADMDPAHQAWIGYSGCSDGVFEYEWPRLPQDLILPLSIWRRQASTALPFALMLQAADGLPRVIDPNVHDWRDDALYYYAEMYSQDLQIRYSAYRRPLDLTKPDSLVPIMMCEDCLGARVGFEYAHARGSAQMGAMKAWADEAFEEIRLGTARRRQRRSFRRKPNPLRSGVGFLGGRWPVT
jgi:hypothetical protein